MVERDPFIVVPKPEDGWAAREQSVGGTTYTALGGEIYAPANPTPDELQRLYEYWIEQHHTPYDVQNRWITDIGYRCAQIAAQQFGADEVAAPVLDLACGTGLVSQGLREAMSIQASHVCLDITTAALRTAQNKPELADCTFIRGDARQLPLRERYFGLVVGSLFINHISEQDRLPLFQRVHDLLQPDGLCILIDTPNNPAATVVERELDQTFATRTTEDITHFSDNAPGGFPLRYHITARR